MVVLDGGRGARVDAGIRRAGAYIGNGPHFMVKAIADERGIKMPSFFGYLFRWTLPVLIPAFLIVTFVFFL